MTRCDKILSGMKKILSYFFGAEKRNIEKSRYSGSDYKQDVLVKQGREQFKKLLDKGLGIPVALL